MPYQPVDGLLWRPDPSPPATVNATKHGAAQISSRRITNRNFAVPAESYERPESGLRPTDAFSVITKHRFDAISKQGSDQQLALWTRMHRQFACHPVVAVLRNDLVVILVRECH